MTNKKYLKSAVLAFSIFATVYSLAGCAKPLDESALADETKKIVKKTTNLNRGESSGIEVANNIVNDSNALSNVDESGANLINPIEESLNESFSRKFSEWEETYEAGAKLVEEYEEATGSQAHPYGSTGSEASPYGSASSENSAIRGGSETQQNSAKGAVSLRVNKPKIDKNFGVTEATGGWKYGITPIIWKYVAPNTKLISNTKPNSSETFGNRVCATSGEYGCFIPCFAKNVPEGANWTGALCCFEELKDDPYNYTYETGLSDITYKDIKVSELLLKNADATEVTIGLWTLNGEYINIIYVDELDEIINTYYKD